MHNALPLLKLLADDARLRILQALSEKDMYVELLSERLQLSPATISFHMKKLQAAGLVDVKREQYYSVYSLRREPLNTTLASHIFSAKTDASDEAQREEQYRRKIVHTFMPNGICKVMPAQIKKRMVIYGEIFKRFTPERSYTEKEVNELISAVHEDYCSVRRDFIGLGWMQREKGIYTVNPNPDLNALL